MASNNEIRQAVAAQRKAQRMAQREDRAMEEGRAAAWAGEPSTAVRYRRGNLRNAWLRGWQAGSADMESQRVSASLTPEQRRALVARWRQVREALEK